MLNYNIVFDDANRDTVVSGSTTVLAQLIEIQLTDKMRKQSVKMGTKSTGFVDEALLAATQHRAYLPQNFDLAAYQNIEQTFANITDAIEATEPLLARLHAYRFVLSSQLMQLSNQVYAALKVAQKAHPELTGTVNRMAQRYAQRNAPAKSQKPSTE